MKITMYDNRTEKRYAQQVIEKFEIKQTVTGQQIRQESMAGKTSSNTQIVCEVKAKFKTDSIKKWKIFNNVATILTYTAFVLNASIAFHITVQYHVMKITMYDNRTEYKAYLK